MSLLKSHKQFASWFNKITNQLTTFIKVNYFLKLSYGFVYFIILKKEKQNEFCLFQTLNF